MSTSTKRSYKCLSDTTDLPDLRICEVVLQTARWQEMNAWYEDFLGKELCAKAPGKHWWRVNDANNQLFVLFHFPELADGNRQASGLNHVQFKAGSLADAFDRFEALRNMSIRPYRSSNHGAATAFYYRDPDGNTMEISGPNFDTEAEYRAYLTSKEFEQNPKGIDIDPDVYLEYFRAGVKQSDLIRLDFAPMPL